MSSVTCPVTITRDTLSCHANSTQPPCNISNISNISNQDDISDDNDKDTHKDKYEDKDKDKDKMLKRPITCYIFEKQGAQGYKI